MLRSGRIPVLAGHLPHHADLASRKHGQSAVDTPLAAHSGEYRITLTTGFDLSGLDLHTGGTLEKNISFLGPLVRSNWAFHFETVIARLDNLFGSRWLNIKMGKFELDNLLSEKRILTLTGNGGVYQSTISFRWAMATSSAKSETTSSALK